MLLTMPRAKPKKHPVLPDNSRVILEQLVPPERRRHGIYEIGKITVTEGDFGPNEKGERSVVINRGSTTVDRWHATGALHERQMDAVKLYRWAWHMTFSETRVTMNWSAFASMPMRGGGLTLEHFIATAIEARETLAEMDRDIFGRLPHARFDSWQNVVIFDEPAGLAGSRLGFSGRDSAQTAALTNCQLICDLICTGWNL
jgi:hypothetical protein